MSRNRIVTIFLSFISTIVLFFIGIKLIQKPVDGRIEDMNNQSMKLDIVTEDDKIMQGLWYEENGDLLNSYKVFSNLYKETRSKAYQLKKIHLSLLLNKDLDISSKELEALYAKEPNNKDVLKLILTLHLMQNRFEQVNKEAQRLSQISSDYSDLEVASDAFLYSNEPNKALDILKKIYDETSRDDIAIKIASILSNLYGKHDQAIKLLRLHIQKFGKNQAVEQKIDEIEKIKNIGKGKI